MRKNPRGGPFIRAHTCLSIHWITISFRKLHSRILSNERTNPFNSTVSRRYNRECRSEMLLSNHDYNSPVCEKLIFLPLECRSYLNADNTLLKLSATLSVMSFGSLDSVYWIIRRAAGYGHLCVILDVLWSLCYFLFASRSLLLQGFSSPFFPLLSRFSLSPPWAFDMP